MPTKVIFETTPDHLGVLWRDIASEMSIMQTSSPLSVRFG
jgi:hypothetical protein